jgi:hypothetical protein
VSVECGSNSIPDIGCTAERQDALAAYTMALLWTITLDHHYADKAVSIFNAWSPMLQNHTDSNEPLQTRWSGVAGQKLSDIHIGLHFVLIHDLWKEALLIIQGFKPKCRISLIRYMVRKDE